jgi:DNA-binding transcriptional regulator YiaG
MGQAVTAEEFTQMRKILFRTQQEVATALGVNQTTISRWETGRQPVPRLAQLALERLSMNNNRRKKK